MQSPKLKNVKKTKTKTVSPAPKDPGDSPHDVDITARSQAKCAQQVVVECEAFGELFYY